MKFTQLLEVSVAVPKQYRVTVLEDRTDVILTHTLNSPEDGFVQVGYYDDVDELITVLTAHIQMENSR